MKDEVVVFVDESGQPTGETAPKLDAHTATTSLHLAFSCYVFNDRNELLVTQRSLKKKVWPGVWTNSVCGHPGPEESMTDAIARRLDYELGMQAAGFEVMLPTYRYKTPPFNGIVENEYCPVFVAKATSDPEANPEEVEDLRWMKWEDFKREALADTQDVWSWWCKDQIRQLEQNKLFADWLTKLTS